MNTMPHYLLFLFCGVLTFISPGLSAQNQITGTWYVNGRAELPCTITQQDNNLIFTVGNNSSNGYFTNANTVYATQWNAYATLTTGAQGLLWNNQLWTRNTYSGYVQLQGSWGLANYQEVYTFEQDNTFFTLTYQGKKLIGYFTSANTITVPEWSYATANIAADGSSITWSNQVWVKKSGTTTNPPPANTGATQQLCRAELSSFYFAAQALGSAWGRMATEGSMLSPDAITACTDHLNALDGTLGLIQCIVFDRGRIRDLQGQLPRANTRQLVAETESLIRDLQTVVQQLSLSCNNNVQLSSLYIAGIHLGAAQAWASSRQCMPTPMPAAVQNVIQNHLNTASSALGTYTACIPQFDMSGFGRVNLASMNSIMPHTQIVGMETQLLWAIALSDCCCTCSPGGTTGSGGSDCDAECERYCKSIGKQYGRYNGRTPCLLGVVSGGSSSGCDCW